jgi:hypothetical protein
MIRKPNPAPDADIINLTMTLGQLRLLDKLVGVELAEIETYGEIENGFKAKDLQNLTDLFWDYVQIPRTAEEHQAWIDSWSKNAQEAL